MRYKFKEQPKKNEHRIIKKFLILPKTLSREIRWLEYATILQRWNWYHEEWQDEGWER